MKEWKKATYNKTTKEIELPIGNMSLLGLKEYAKKYCSNDQLEEILFTLENEKGRVVLNFMNGAFHYKEK